MKKVILLAFPLLLGACAMNINHNIATVQGKTYLVETKNRWIFGFFEWSSPSTFELLEGERLEQESFKKYRKKAVKECKKNSRIRVNSVFKYDSEKFDACMRERLKKWNYIYSTHL